MGVRTWVGSSAGGVRHVLKGTLKALPRLDLPEAAMAVCGAFIRGPSYGEEIDARPICQGCRDFMKEEEKRYGYAADTE